MKKYFELTKLGIVFFVLFTASGGFLLGHPMHLEFPILKILLTLAGLYFLSSGSFALNQYQEREIDKKMPRTQSRPLPSGAIEPKNALLFAISFLLIGAGLCFAISTKVGVLGLATVLMYNFLYTKLWKLRSPFAAVPGAIPGAMPFVIGYTAASDQIWTIENLYFFLVMFFWQMPHFWALAIRYKDDYKAAGIPVLPAAKSARDTEYYMGLYTFAYVILALAAPLFAPVGWAYLILAIPFAFKVLWEFFRFIKNPDRKRWVGFFLWTTFSILIFVLVPAVDRWSPWLF
ncbi:MAG: heme o synthase [Bdellovibrionales bacterium]|nr:heme o synthase [Bdellovibrionales bacterium]